MNAVEEFVISLDEERREVVIYLHHLFTEKLSLKPKMRYGLPFYDDEKWLCYINPKRTGGVELVFLDGQKLEDPSGILDPAGRKMVAGIMIHSLEDIPEQEIIALVAQVIS